MKDKLNITIRIADLPPMSLSILRAEEEVNRTAEYNVNKLFVAWSERFKDKTSNEIMGMVAFQFAKLYQNLAVQTNAMNELLENFEDDLNRLLLDVKADKAEE